MGDSGDGDQETDTTGMRIDTKTKTETETRAHDQPASPRIEEGTTEAEAAPLHNIDASTSLAADTVELLETRLRRLEFMLTGDISWTGEVVGLNPVSVLDDTVSARMEALENELLKLMAKVPAVKDVLNIYSRFPDLFQTIPADSIPSTLSPQALTSMVLSYASAFPETASRLTSLNDLPIPPAELSASLTELQPRLDKLALVQDEQARAVSALRTRSALLAQRLVEVDLVGGSEVMAEWEERIEKNARDIRRLEVKMRDSDEP